MPMPGPILRTVAQTVRPSIAAKTAKSAAAMRMGIQQPGKSAASNLEEATRYQMQRAAEPKKAPFTLSPK